MGLRLNNLYIHNEFLKTNGRFELQLLNSIDSPNSTLANKLLFYYIYDAIQSAMKDYLS